jgi:hypothetical protein
MNAEHHGPDRVVGLPEDVDPQNGSVARRHFDVTLYDYVGRWIGHGDRRLGGCANASKGIAERAGSAPRPVQGGCRVWGHAVTLERAGAHHT